jgi:hypothetical protein
LRSFVVIQPAASLPGCRYCAWIEFIFVALAFDRLAFTAILAGRMRQITQP